MLGSYPNGKPSDPETYIASIVAVLVNYPEEIVERVTDTVNGLPRTSEFFPSVAKVAAACDKEMLPLWVAQRDAKKVREANAAKLLEKRRNPEEDKRMLENLRKLSDDLKKRPDAGEDLKQEAFRLQAERTKRVLRDLADKKASGVRQ